jgi:hypothetical protein
VEQTRPPRPLERQIETSSYSRSRLSTTAAATFLRQRAPQLRRPPPVRRRWPDLVDPVSLYLPHPFFFFPATGMTMAHPGGEARPGHRGGARGWGRQGWRRRAALAPTGASAGFFLFSILFSDVFWMLCRNQEKIRQIEVRRESGFDAFPLPNRCGILVVKLAHSD